MSADIEAAGCILEVERLLEDKIKLETLGMSMVWTGQARLQNRLARLVDLAPRCSDTMQDRIAELAALASGLKSH